MFFELIKSSGSISGLIHDWGKSWDQFMAALATGSKDPVRHEYISLILFSAFVDGRKAEQWLNDLKNAQTINEEQLVARANEIASMPLFELLPDEFSRIIGWLILSHHLQPEFPKNNVPRCREVESLLKQIREKQGYLKIDEAIPALQFSLGLPCRSEKWCKAAGHLADQAIAALQKTKEQQMDWQTWFRPVLYYSHIAVVFGDHEASMRAEKPQAGAAEKIQSASNQRPLAKSLKPGFPPVYLDSHLVDAAQHAASACELLFFFRKPCPACRQPML